MVRVSESEVKFSKLEASVRKLEVVYSNWWSGSVSCSVGQSNYVVGR